MSQHILQTIEEAFQAKEVKYELRFEAEQNCHVFILNMRGTNGLFTLFWKIIHESFYMLLLGLLPVNVPLNRRQDVGLLLNRINYTLNFGNFELDDNDGEIRFRFSSVFDPDLPFSKQVIIAHLTIFMVVIDEKLPEIMATIYGGTTNHTESKTQVALPFWCN